MLTGENGILTQAQRAKTETENAQSNEEMRLGQYESYINRELGESATVGEIVTGGNKPYTNNGTAIIPEGFMIVPGCSDISKGLVISDDPSDTEVEDTNIVAEGNQFVWIPVTSESEYQRNTTYYITEISAVAYTDMNYLPKEIQPEIAEGSTGETAGLLNEQAERNAVLSVGGFYISRYEAGNETEENMNKLVSKNGATVWSNISQENCKTEAKNFINNGNAKSALCSGVQWDSTMRFITENDPSYDVTTYNSSRHTGAKANAGANPEDKACNIYDLEGNYGEYVAEISYCNPTMPIVNRGGNSEIDNTDPASSRFGYTGDSAPRTFISLCIVRYVEF